MPIYEFECTCCPSRFELKRGFHEDSPVTCPACGGKARKCFSSVPIIFKGSGFYVTDTRGGSSYTSTPSAADDKSTPTDSTVSSTETKVPKAEAKVEAKVPARKSKTT